MGARGLFGSVAAALALATSSPAGARPLPKGMTIVLDKDKQQLMVHQDGLVVPLQDADAAQQVDRYDGASLSDDGKTIDVKSFRCNDPDDPITVPLASVQARLENLRGMQEHLRHHYAAAIPHFALAAQTDPATPMYATNLLSAQSMAKQLDDADRTLATYGPKHPVWFAWRLTADRELANVRGRASARALLAPKRSTITAAALDKAIAVDPAGRTAVKESVMNGGPGSPVDDQLVIYDAAGTALFRLPLADGCEGPMGQDLCTRAMRASNAAHAREATAVLQALGFQPVATTWLQPETGSGQLQFASKDGKTTALIVKDVVTVTRDSTRLTAHEPELAGDQWLGIAGSRVIFRWVERFGQCDSDEQHSLSAFAPLR